MNQALAPFKPRLVMLKHTTRNLLERLSLLKASQHQPWTAPQPLQPERLQQQGARQLQVFSLKPLELPASPGTLACLSVDCQQEAMPQTRYQLPQLEFELLDPQNQVIDKLMIPCGQFSTFAHGRLSHHLQEYLASVLNIELAGWQFQALRKGGQLQIQALPVRLGWNLRLADVSFPATKLPTWSGGLSSGMSTQDPLQQSGQFAFLWWGPFQINEQIYQLCLPYSGDRELFQELFLEELNLQLSPNALQARFTPDQRLLLIHQEAGKAIQIQAEPAPELQDPHQALELPLPEGEHQPPYLQVLGSLTLNGHELHFQAPVNAVSQADFEQWLLQQFNQAVEHSGVMASISPHNHLILTPIQTAYVELSAVSGPLAQLLGLSTLPENLLQFSQQTLEQWSTLLSRLLQDAGSVLLSCFPEPPAHLGAFSEQGLQWSADPLEQAENLQNWLLELQQALEPLLASSPVTQQEKLHIWAMSEAPVSAPASKPVAFSHDRNTPSVPEGPKPRFDHKI